MRILEYIFLGIVQGLTELLPISSSAHLALIPTIFNWNIPESFDVALHFGTLLAIGIFFFKDWIDLIIGGYKKVIKKEDSIELIAMNPYYPIRKFTKNEMDEIPVKIIGKVIEARKRKIFE